MERRCTEGREIKGPMLNLTGKEIEFAYDFLDKLESQPGIGETPEIEFQPGAKVFICIPLDREQANLERLFQSWNNQELPDGMQLEIIILINNKESASSEAVADNQECFDTLLRWCEEQKKPGIRFRLLDRFSKGKAIQDGTCFGTLRNLLAAPVVSNSAKTGKDALILTTDADCAPSANLAVELQKAFGQLGKKMYGGVELELKLADGMSDEDKYNLERIYLINDIHEMLLDYLTTGRWEKPETMVGGNTFYTVSEFVQARGYPNQKSEIGEDVQLNSRLYLNHPVDQPRYLDTASITSIERLETRGLVGSDSGKMEDVKDRGYKLPYTTEVISKHAHLRRWLLESRSQGLPFVDGLAQLVNSDWVGQKQKGLLKSKEKEFTVLKNDMDRYEHLFTFLLEQTYEEVEPRSIDEILKDTARTIEKLLSKDKRFQTLKQKLSREQKRIVRVRIDKSSFSQICR